MILVVGGAGYIGSLMVKTLVDSGEEVVVLDNLSRGHAEAVRGATLLRGDLRSRDDLARAFARPVECVMHFAAFASVGESVAAPEIYYENNVVACWNLLEAMRAAGTKLMVFSSSAAVYGEPRAVPISEDHPQEPTNPYGETKRVMEQMLRWYAGAHGIRSVSLRYFNAAGADPGGTLGEDHDPESHLIPLVLDAARGARGAVSVFGTDWDTPDGTCIRDYVHILDLCQAHSLALARLRGGAVCEAYNLGSGHGYSVLDVIRTAESVVGHPIPWTPAARRPGDPARLVASSENARRVLGWKPRFEELATIVGHAWAFRSRHPNGYAQPVAPGTGVA